jgi:hypothetical protein
MAVPQESFTNARDLEQAVIEWTDAVYNEAEQEFSNTPEVKLTGKLIDYIEGRQWSPNARFGRSRPVANRIFRQFIEMVGLLTDIEPDFKVTFADKRDGFSQLEDLLNSMISDWATMSDFEMELSQTVMYGLIHTGWGKVQWNPALNHGLGDVQFLPISPINILEVGTQSSPQDAECIIYRYPATLAALKRKYGSVADGVRPESGMSNAPAQMMRPAKMPSSQWSKLSPQLKNLLGQKNEGVGTKYPVALVKEFWMKDDSVWDGRESLRVGPELANWSYVVERGMPIYPRGRLVVTAGRKALDDNCNPYWHGMAPFAKYRPYRVPWKSAGLSPLEPLAAIQNILNRINGGIMDTINAAIEPTLIAPKAAFSQQSWDSMDPTAAGGKLQYNNNTPRPPEFRKPPELGSYVITQKQDLEKEQDATSGSAAIQQALGKKQVPGGDSLDMIMNAKSTNIRFMGRSLKSFLTEIGQMTACNMMQFSSAKSRAAKYGGKGLLDSDFGPMYGNMLPAGMEPEEFVRLCSFTIRKGSLLAIEKNEELPVAFGLRKAGDLSRKGLYRKLDGNFDTKRNEKELVEEAMQKMGIAALGAAAAGKDAGGHHGGKK